MFDSNIITFDSNIITFDSNVIFLTPIWQPQTHQWCSSFMRGEVFSHSHHHDAFLERFTDSSGVENVNGRDC